eukprot:Platyproteum_vivax@DN6031_c0_g1_i1.p1
MEQLRYWTGHCVLSFLLAEEITKFMVVCKKNKKMVDELSIGRILKSRFEETRNEEFDNERMENFTNRGKLEWLRLLEKNRQLMECHKRSLVIIGDEFRDREVIVWAQCNTNSLDQLTKALEDLPGNSFVTVTGNLFTFDRMSHETKHPYNRIRQHKVHIHNNLDKPLEKFVEGKRNGCHLIALSTTGDVYYWHDSLNDQPLFKICTGVHVFLNNDLLSIVARDMTVYEMDFDRNEREFSMKELQLEEKTKLNVQKAWFRDVKPPPTNPAIIADDFQLQVYLTANNRLLMRGSSPTSIRIYIDAPRPVFKKFTHVWAPPNIFREIGERRTGEHFSTLDVRLIEVIGHLEFPFP